MGRFDKLYRLIEQEAPLFTEHVKAAVRESRDEAEFRSKIFQDIEAIAGKLGIDLLVREEYTLATGRADAVYNRLIIEYEPPGSLRADLAHGRTKHAVKQVQYYIEGIAKREGHKIDRLLGVAFDGSYYIFVRYRDGHWYIESPLEVTPTSTTRFLRALISLSSGRALIPENLVDDFGHQNLYSQRVARALYHALDGHVDDLTAKLFAQWQLFFSQVSGYEEATVKLRDKVELRQFARGMGLRPEGTDPPRLLFSIHTYFSFLVKVIARLVLERYAAGSLGTTPLIALANLEGEALRHELRKLEDGGIFRALGLQNLLEGDFFGWYLNAWTPDVEAAVKLVLSRLSEYNPATIEEDPYAARDLLKKLYHYLMPRELRHDLGEYYTPDWLAERVLTQLNEPVYQMPKSGVGSRHLDVNKRLLDPACGSGTFLVLAIRALKEHCRRQGLGETETLEIILNNIAGIDLNPLAVMAARVNYLLSIADLVPYRRSPLEIPVYLADSILTPAEGKDLWEHGRLILKTVVGDLPVSAGINTRDEMEKLTALLEDCVEETLSPDDFWSRARTILSLQKGTNEEGILRELYEKLLALEQRGLNRVWARVLKNAFMPLFLGQFDYVVGNPPWVNWDSLPPQYRDRTKRLWFEYALFYPFKGMDVILGKGETDISMLMTYVAADRFLKDGGKLAFVITQTVFKTSPAQGFRRFRIGDQGAFLQILHVDDLSEIKPFEGASNRTSVFVLRKGAPTRYPVPYTYWKKVSKGEGIDYDSTLDEVFSQLRRLNFQAIPVNPKDRVTPWLTARPGALGGIRKVLGRSDYVARVGVHPLGANGVFWMEVLSQRPGGLVVVRNITEGQKRKVESITAEIEANLLYPLMRGRDVQRWKAEPSANFLCTHEPGWGLKAIPEEAMQLHYPRTFKYLKRHEDVLKRRQSQVIRGLMARGPFYSVFGIGDYTFARHKVVWREQAARLTCAVVGLLGGKVVIPDHKLTLVATGDEREATYLCGILNSTPAGLAAWAYVISIQQSTHIVENIRVPKFRISNELHRRLAELSQQAHSLAAQGDRNNLDKVQTQIDSAAAELWGITDKELVNIRRNFEELLGESTNAQQAREDDGTVPLAVTGRDA
jgi:hypothetical protein